MRSEGAQGARLRSARAHRALRRRRCLVRRAPRSRPGARRGRPPPGRAWIGPLPRSLLRHGLPPGDASRARLDGDGHRHLGGPAPPRPRPRRGLRRTAAGERGRPALRRQVVRRSSSPPSRTPTSRTSRRWSPRPPACSRPGTARLRQARIRASSGRTRCSSSARAFPSSIPATRDAAATTEATGIADRPAREGRRRAPAAGRPPAGVPARGLRIDASRSRSAAREYPHWLALRARGDGRQSRPGTISSPARSSRTSAASRRGSRAPSRSRTTSTRRFESALVAQGVTALYAPPGRGLGGGAAAAST